MSKSIPSKITSRYKTLFQSLISILRRHAGLIIVLFIVFLITYRQVISYYTPVEYEEMGAIASKLDTLGSPNPSDALFFRVKFSTRRAFLPYEKIRIKIDFATTIDSLYQKLNADTLYVILNNAELTNAGVNNANKKFDESITVNDANSFTAQALLDFSVSTAYIVLTPSERVGVFSGEAEVTFRKPGQYSFVFTTRNLLFSESPPIKLEIGSLVETMNKKTNDLLYVLTVLSLLLALYSEFRSKSEQTVIKQKSS